MFFSIIIRLYLARSIVPKPAFSLADLRKRAESGRARDVDFLMKRLDVRLPSGHLKMIDYALSFVSTEEGKERIRHYLFSGKKQIQRNYAALYFKRNHAMELLKEAVRKGCIDRIQAFSR